MPFEVNVITPFENVTLEVGGGVETYWKSTASAIPSFSPSPAITLAQGIRQTRRLGSTQTSPSAFSIASTTTSTRSQALTITSLRGDYIYVVVQVTKDLHPVAYTDWRLPEPSYDLGVSDITLAQFEALALKCGRALQPGQTLRARDWPKLNIMVSLAQLMLVRTIHPSYSWLTPYNRASRRK